jgi:hypothetical protein
MAGSAGEAARLARRAALGAIGTAAGLAGWVLVRQLPQRIADPQLYVLLLAFTAGYFTALLALVGPLRLRAALPWAAVPAGIAAALLGWASLRYDTLDELFGRPDALFAYAIVLVLPLPYLVAALRPGVGWRDYPTLFEESWGMVLRIAAAAVFVAIAWLAAMMSNELLKLVGIDLIGRLMRIDWLPAAFSGLVGGLALATIDELPGLASPALLLRLLRLLILPVLLVVAVFVAAVPVQGVGSLFGALSPAATLLGIGLAMLLLVAVGVDADDRAVRRGAVTLAGTAGLGLLLPVVAGLALEALRQRYGDAGLSPARIAAGVAGGVLLAYGLAYAVAVLRGRGWRGRLRAANGWMGLVLVALAAAWLSPLLDAGRLAAADQVARFEDGRLGVEEVDLWTLRHDWGRAGRAALARIEALAAGHPDEARLRERLALSAQAPDRYAFWDVPRDPVILNARAQLRALMPVVPPEAVAEFDRYVLPWYAGSVASFLDGCKDLTPSGRPGCVLVVHDLVPGTPGNEAILFYKSFGLLRGEVIVPEPVFRRADAAEVFSIPPPDFAETDALIERLQDGGFSAGPARINAITIGDRQFTVPF